MVISHSFAVITVLSFNFNIVVNSELFVGVRAFADA